MNSEKMADLIIKDLINHGLITVGNKKTMEQYLILAYGVGFDAGRSTHTVKKPVVQMSMHEVELVVWNSAQEAGRKTGIDPGGIIKTCRGQKNSAGGFKWKYKN